MQFLVYSARLPNTLLIKQEGVISSPFAMRLMFSECFNATSRLMAAERIITVGKLSSFR
jgi:hypothetical protein